MCERCGEIILMSQLRDEGSSVSALGVLDCLIGCNNTFRHR